MDWKAVARTALAPLTAGHNGYRSALLQPPEQKLQFLPGTQAALIGSTGDYDTPLVHGPGATDLWHRRGAESNSAVFACLLALAWASTEPVLRVYRRNGPGKKEELPDHPLQALLARPNPGHSAPEVWGWVTRMQFAYGNAYLRKLRSGNKRTGNVVELWPVSPRRMTFLTAPGDLITTYVYHRGPGDDVLLRPEDVVHFRLELDDQDMRQGLAALHVLGRELSTDRHASEWADQLLANGAYPGAVLTADGSIDETTAQALSARLQALYGNENRGKTAVLGNGAKLDQFGFNPEEMLMREHHRLPEERISAVLRTPAIVAGLGAGLDQATYSNARSLTEFFTERTLVPLWQRQAATVQAQLKPNFATDPRIIVEYDLNEVRALQEDQDAKYARVDKVVNGGILTVNEGRSELGKDPVPNGDVRRVPIAVTEVPTTAAAVPPAEPTPAEPAAAAPGTEPPAAPTPIRQAASRRVGERKAEESDPAVVTEADLAAWRARARALAEAAPLLPDLLAATAGSGNGRH